MPVGSSANVVLRVQGAERVVDLAVDFDPFAQRPLAAAKGAFAGNADFADSRLPWGGFHTIDQFADLLFELFEVDQQIRPEHDEQVSVILSRVERRAGKHPKRLHNKGK